MNYLDSENLNGLNLYSYCYNDPINYVDPSGNIAVFLGIATYELLVAFGIITAIVAVIQIENQTHDIENFIANISNSINSGFTNIDKTNNDLLNSNNIKEEYVPISENYMASVQDPYKRPGQKKQGRELKNKARERFISQNDLVFKKTF